MKRRDFLAKQGLLLASLSLGGALPSLLGRRPAYAEAMNVTINFLGWQGYDNTEAMAPLRAQGLTIDPQYITRNAEIVTKLRSGGVGSIDVVTPGISAVKPLIVAGLIQPIDFAKIPSAERFFDQFRSLDWQRSGRNDFAAPVVWSDYPMNYRADLFKELPQRWADLGDRKYQGRLVTLDDPANLWVFARAMFKTSDFSTLTKAQVEEVTKAYMPIKKNLVTISPSYGDIVDILGRGDAHASVLGWRYVEVQLKRKGFEAGSHVPDDGTFLWCDSYCIASEAPHLAATYAFIDHMLSPEANAIIAAGTGSGVVNAGSIEFLPDEQKSLYPYDRLHEFLSKNTFYIAPQIEAEGEIATMRDWAEAWERIKLS